VILAIGNDSQFRRFCAAAGRPEIAADQKYATNPARVADRAVLVPLLQELMRARGTKAWVAAL
jgi:crotonobetainyl-CoA:carnitine CoA-transferase CaiB-like acyl-CoA transferase